MGEECDGLVLRCRNSRFFQGQALCSNLSKQSIFRARRGIREEIVYRCARVATHSLVSSKEIPSHNDVVWHARVCEIVDN